MIPAAYITEWSQQCPWISDDTEHAVMTLLSLRDSDGDGKKFAKALASRLRWWLASVPAGIGLATARSIIKLWLGLNQTWLNKLTDWPLSVDFLKTMTDSGKGIFLAELKQLEP